MPVGGMHMIGTGLAAAVTAGRRRHPARHSRHVDHACHRRQRHRRRGGRRSAHRGRRRRVQRRSPRRLPRTAPDLEAPRAARRGKYSPSCVLWVAGVRGLPPADAAHHNIHFGADWDGSFKALIDDGVRMPDPSILVTLHSLDDPTLAPAGCSSLYVLEPTPNLDAAGSTGRRERDRIVDDLRRADRVARVSHRRRRRARCTTRRIGNAWAWNTAPRSHWPTRSSRPVRSDRTTSTEGARARVHRIVDAPRRRRADGARVGQARRRSASTSTPRRGAGRDDALFVARRARAATADHPPAARPGR